MLLYTPNEILGKLIQKIERKRIEKGIKQSELSKRTNIPLSTYKNFLSTKSINAIRLIEILFFLEMEEELKSLLEEPQKELTYKELKDKTKSMEKQRIR